MAEGSVTHSEQSLFNIVNRRISSFFGVSPHVDEVPTPVRGRIFFSYRVSADADIVERMHDKLRALQVDIWWDKRCLKPGQPWEEGFADGLLSSDVFVPFLSKAALAPFASLQLDSKCDNVLLEYRMALELKERGLLRAVHPIFVGDSVTTEELGDGYGDFFAGGGMPRVTDTCVAAVEAKASEHLRRAGKGSGGAVAVADRTVARTLKAICAHQGEFLKGAPKRDAMEKVVHALAGIVKAASGGSNVDPTASKAVDGVVSPKLATIPAEVPPLPDGYVARPDLMDAIKHTVLQRVGTKTTTVSAPTRKTAGAGNTTTTQGMGGVGKTTVTAALVRDPEVRSAFHTICWASVGQEPDVAALQQALYIQLLNKPLPDAARSDERLALGELKAAAKQMSVLLVLDDVWVASHATPLNFIDDSAQQSAVVVTTRMRSLLDGAPEVQCGMLSLEASLELLLRAGGYEQLLGAPPQAAIEAVELCGRLPLALGIAGGIVETLGSSWEAKLCELLKDEFEEASVEERVITASLRIVPEAMRAGVEGLFTLFAIFAEDAIVPAAAIDLLAPLMPGDAATKKSACKMMQVRKWLQQLIKANLVKGTMETGVSAHDLVRDCMIQRAEAAIEGGLRSAQREAVPLLIGAFDLGAAAASYTTSSLHWHVRQAVDPEVAVHKDDTLMRVLTHESGDVRKQGAIGIGVDKLRDAADACDESAEHFEAAQLMLATCAVRGGAAGAEAQRVWASLKKLEAAGRGSTASRLLELRALNILFMATEGGFAVGTTDHAVAMERMERVAGEVSQGIAAGQGKQSKEVMEVEVSLGIAAIGPPFIVEGIADYPGPATRETILQGYGGFCTWARHMKNAATAAPDQNSALVCWENYALPLVQCPRQHILDEFSAVEALGEGGKRFRETIEGYKFEETHAVAKNIGLGTDVFLWGLEPLGLLQWFGDLQSARLGFRKVLDAHKRVLTSVREGAATASEYAGYSMESVGAIYWLAAALLAAGESERATLRAFLNDSLPGAALDDEVVLAGLKTFWNAWGAWKTSDGHVHDTIETFLLVIRGLRALVDEDTDESRAALREWLPPPTELLRIAEYETSWRGHSLGLAHPALLLSLLRGQRLGDWPATIVVAQGVLRIEAFSPLVRTEACRLLGRAYHALGDFGAACEAAEKAVVEAQRAKYAWLELMALRDWLSWCKAAEAEPVREQLRGVAGRLVASQEELAGVLGEGVL